MNKLVVDHLYALASELGYGYDRTRYRNRGYLSPEVGFGRDEFNGTLRFDPNTGSAVGIPPSKSLQDIGALRVICTMLWRGVAHPEHAQCLVEGDQSFLLDIPNDMSLRAVIKNAHGDWVGIDTPPRAILSGRWYTVEFRYDGISLAEIWINGTKVTSHNWAKGEPVMPADTLTGPVRGIGPRGIWIGHRTSTDPRMNADTFNGYIRSVRIYKRDDIEDLLKLIDPCCLRDLSYWYKLAGTLKEKGYDLQNARQILNQLNEISAEAIARLRNGSDRNTEELNQLMRQFDYALIHRNKVPVEPSLRPLIEWISERSDPEQFNDLAAQAQKLIESLPMTPKELLEVGDRLCFSQFRKDVEDILQQTTQAPNRQERSGKKQPKSQA